MTMAQNALKRELKAQLAAQGFSVEIDRWPRKLTYYKPDGEAMPNLPADPVTMHRYINVKKFTLTPPVQKDEAEEAEFQALLDAERVAEVNEHPLLDEEAAVKLLTDPHFDATAPTDEERTAEPTVDSVPEKRTKQKQNQEG